MVPLLTKMLEDFDDRAKESLWKHVHILNHSICFHNVIMIVSDEVTLENSIIIEFRKLM